MKKWRKDAKYHNIVAGQKHQGRVNKPEMYIMMSKMTPLLAALFKKAGIS